MITGFPTFRILRRGLAIVTVGVAILITSEVHSTSYLFEYLIFLLAVMVATWFGGLIAGVSSVLLSTLAVGLLSDVGIPRAVVHNSEFYRIAAYFVPAALTFYLTFIIRRGEIDLRKSEGNYRYLFEGNALPMWIYDNETFKFLAVNEAAAAYFQIPVDEFLQLTLLDITPPEKADSLRRHLASRRPLVEYRGVWPHLKRDGSTFAAEVYARQMSFDGRPACQETAIDVTDKMRVEAFARESESRLSTIIESLSEGLIVGNAHDDFFHMNKAASDILRGEHDPGKITLAAFKERFDICALDGTVLPPEQWPLSIALRGEPVYDLEVLLRFRSNSSERILRCRGSRIDDAEGIPSTALITINDVTERRRAALELQHSQQQLAGIIDSAMDAIITVDDVYRIVHYNTAAEKMFLCPAEAAIGMPLTKFIPERFGEAGAGVFKDFGVTSGGNRIGGFASPRCGLRQNGEEFPLEASISVADADGVKLYTIIIRDITSRKAALDALKQSEERYRDLVENALDIIYTQDLDGKFTSVNKAVEKITGYTPDEALTLDMTECLSNEAILTSHQMTASKLGGRGTTDYQVEVIGKDGRPLTMDVNSWLVFENGVPVGIQGIARDVTERAHLEEKLRQSQKLESIGMLAGGVAHDFNNLLTVINGYSDLALKKLGPNNPARANVEQIKGAGERGGALTSQLLAFSRKQVLTPKVHNLNSVITQLNSMLRRLIRESIELKTDLDPALWNIKADPGQIEQVIMNLTVNARDAMAEGGRLTLETRNIVLHPDDIDDYSTLGPGRYVRLRMTDSGYGMTEDTLSRVFEPFFTTKEIGKGSGLGLSTVHGIVKQSGGDVAVVSEVGKGTTFDILLPMVGETMTDQVSEKESAPAYLGNEMILVVEDDENVRRLATEVLKTNGYRVIAATGGAHALSILDRSPERFHLLLTDMVMPEMSGRVLQHHVAELRPEIRTLFMSGYAEEATPGTGAASLENDLIEKPFTPDALAKKVREVLDAVRS